MPEINMSKPWTLLTGLKQEIVSLWDSIMYPINTIVTSRASSRNFTWGRRRCDTFTMPPANH